MKEQNKMRSNIFKCMALLVAAGIVLGIFLFGRLGSWAKSDRAIAGTRQSEHGGGDDMSGTPQRVSSGQHSEHEHHAMPTNTESPAKRTILYWYDPMHPAYTSDKPGIAPDCGMQLEPVYADGAYKAAGLAQSPSSLPSGSVRIDPIKQQLFGVSVAPVQESSGNYNVRLLGRVAADE